MSLWSFHHHDKIIALTDRTPMDGCEKQRRRRRKSWQVSFMDQGHAEGDKVSLTFRDFFAEGLLWVFIHFQIFAALAICIAAVSLLFHFLDSLLDIDIQTHDVEMEVLLASRRLHRAIQS
eukprot:scaffold1736_cov127-Cylindrotheca_fusiformis.AAC.85